MNKIYKSVYVIILICILLFYLFYRSINSNTNYHKFHMSYVFSSDKAIEKGLMFRKKPLPKNSGALFKFNPPRNVSFWMKNTFIPLDLLLLNSKHTVIALHKDMTPLNETKKYTGNQVSYAIEMNAGTLNAHNIKVGDIITFDNIRL